MTQKPLDLEAIKARVAIVQMLPLAPGDNPTPMDMLAKDADALVREVERLRLGVRRIVRDNMLTVPDAQTQLLALLGKE